MKSKLRIILFIPNIIGYIRILLLVFFYYYFNKYPALSILSCVLSHVLDGFDGMAAWYFNQTSEFGYNLDMLIDWMATLVVIFKIFEIQNPLFKTLWTMIMLFYIIDITSHWL